jgi:hypothetical protein
VRLPAAIVDVFSGFFALKVCALSSPAVVLKHMALPILNEPDLEFASLVVQVCMLVLMTGKPTAQLRMELRGDVSRLVNGTADGDKTWAPQQDPSEVSNRMCPVF